MPTKSTFNRRLGHLSGGKMGRFLIPWMSVCICIQVICPVCSQQVDFNRDIRPILSDTCYKCHGPDEHDRQADLRLDTKDGLFEDSAAVIPNDLDSSEIYQRVMSDDPDSLMPPLDSGRKLSDSQKQLIKRWIEQGAPWEVHWSLVTPTKPVVPKVNPGAQSINPIDRFVVSELESRNLHPAPPANRETLMRRVAFDLSSLPPSPELLEKYLKSSDVDWYEQLVDELLDSPHYGEHMARFWLDAARYGDTHGLHLDNYREMWSYRDWVVSAFNNNLSYRDFTIAQLAGDLLDNPTDDQLIASGFNRAHITTNEGGAIVEEVYVRNVVDRISTTGTVFMGMTIGCAQCHDHKFDPISQKEFYQLFAFFNNLTDPPMDKNIKNPAPVMKVFSEQQKKQVAEFSKKSELATQALHEQVANFAYTDPADVEVTEIAPPESETTEPTEFVWVEDDVLPIGAKPEQKWEYVVQSQGPVHSGSKSRVAVAGNGLVQHFFTGAASPLKAQAGDKFFAYVNLDAENPPEQIMLQFNDGNWEHRVYWGDNKINWGQDKSPSRFYAGSLPEKAKWVRLEIEAEKIGFQDLSLINGIAFTQWGGKANWDSAGIVSKTSQATGFKSLKKWLEMARQTKGAGMPDDLKKLVNKPADQLGQPGQQKLREYFLTKIHPEATETFSATIKQRDTALAELNRLNNAVPTTLISRENPTIKPAFLLDRGEYDQKGERVERNTPKALPEFPDDLPRNRLGFAKWLTTDKHPLTARVAVNRFWQQVFGTGVVKTSEDFGAQGEMPSHPELLDWLATDFVQHNWDVKRVMKMIVMSATYRQSSFASPDLQVRDPDNRWLARGPRFRLDAEMLRDQALAVSGLLVPTLGGPGVKPPQPAGLWFAVGYSGSNTVRFSKDNGPEKVHRRSLYTFWKRTAPPPQMNTFDAPSREECRVRRERTNTPLQALLLMNDPQYIEAARNFAQLTMDSQPENDRAAIRFMIQRAVGRISNKAELAIILKDLKGHREEFESNPNDAAKLVAIGEKPADPEYKVTELASWTMIANLIMNMDEFVTKN